MVRTMVGILAGKGGAEREDRAAGEPVWRKGLKLCPQRAMQTTPSSDPRKHQKAGSHSPALRQLGLWFPDEVSLTSKAPRTQAEASEDPRGVGWGEHSWDPHRCRHGGPEEGLVQSVTQQVQASSGSSH